MDTAGHAWITKKDLEEAIGARGVAKEAALVAWSQCREVLSVGAPLVAWEPTSVGGYRRAILVESKWLVHPHFRAAHMLACLDEIMEREKAPFNVGVKNGKLLGDAPCESTSIVLVFYTK